MSTFEPTRTILAPRRDAPVNSFSIANPGASTSGGVIYTSMPHETLSSRGKFAVSVYAYVGIAFLIATFLFALGYAFFKVRRDRGKRNYDLDSGLDDADHHTRYVSKSARLKCTQLGKLNMELAHDVKKKQAKASKAGRQSTLEVPSLEPSHTLKRSGSAHTLSNPVKRVSWASSTSTVRDSKDLRPGSSVKPIHTPENGAADSYSQKVAPISPLPRVQDSRARVNVSHLSDPRALQRQELVGTASPDICQDWSTPDRAGEGDGMQQFLTPTRPARR
ncbi:hypothetical protein Agabi119p4_4821 [Agaricus bisporus var. burnettii]|uniref:Uncharacterized protein n=1 Tax=Agaricus bisporus var. burnettii TaxID=192524 RepID=A0A8H7F418_AGABI|nr:hypothetical protein Agabi119p4_4821 [Agaricus bisporus var. burnettii]